MPDADAYRPLAEILGHNPGHCRVPKGDINEKREWTQDVFRNVVKLAISDHDRRHLIFVDLLFARVEDDSFFGGIAVANDRVHDYRRILKSMFGRYITVGSHPEFQRGLTDNKYERWLFSEWNDCNQTVDRTNPPPVDLVSIYEDADDILSTLTPPTVFSRWRDQAAKTSVADSWKQFVKSLRDDAAFKASNLNCVGGIPLVIPLLGESPLPVAALFLGVAAPNNVLDRAAYMADIARRLIPFALRTFSLQKAEQAARFERAKAAERIYTQIHSEIGTLIRQVGDLQSTTNRINAAISIAHDDYLGHYSALEKLFVIQRTPTTYYYLRSDDKVEFSFEKRNGFKSGSFQSLHTSGDAENHWDDIARFLKIYGESQNVPLFCDFGDLKGPKNAERFHDLLKTIVQRPWASSACVFELQIVIAIATACRQMLGSDVSIAVQKEGGSAIQIEAVAGNLNLADFVEAIPAEFLACDDKTAGVIRGETDVCRVLGALMRLVAVELRKGKRSHEEVEANTIVIASASTHIDVTIKCSGHFNDLSFVKWRDNAGNHGFRECVATLCSAVGQLEPVLATTSTVERLKEFADIAPQARFSIGQPDVESGKDCGAVFFIRFIRRILSGHVTTGLSDECVVREN